MTRLLATAAAVSLLATAALAQAPTPAAATAFKLGAFEVSALSDALYPVPNDGKTFGKDPAAAGKLLAAAGQPTDKITLGVDALLVKSPGHVILFDTGLGAPISALTASLAKAGVTPADVTDVFITHYHGDHVGGLKGADGKAAFSKATVRMSANEWKTMQADTGSKAVTAAIAGQVKTFEPGAEVVPGVTPVALYGHTPGHVAYRISSGGQTLVDIGDTVHSAIVGLAEPAWFDAFDGDADGAIKARAGELKALADGKVLIFAPHFPYPGVGHVVAAGTAYQWAPGVPK
jgi:glyoxylase-like metal-dependent hydrolase (beta-lactamase superfamily II)